MPNITNLRRTNGGITYYEEDGEIFEVTQNSLGKPASIQSRRGKWTEEKSVFSYDSNGRFLGLTGDIETTLLPALLAEAAGTAIYATDPLTGVISFTAGGITTYPVQNFTFATLPAAASYQGMQSRVTDLNNALFESNGTRWKPVNNIAVIGSLDTDFAMSGVTETVAFQKLLPAGLLKNGDRLRLRCTLGKSSTVETTTFALRLGPAGTIADALLHNAFSIMATTTVSFGLFDDFRRLSATTLRKLGNGSQGTQYAGGATAATTAPVTVSNMDSTALYLSATLMQSSTAETATMYDMTLELVSSAS